MASISHPGRGFPLNTASNRRFIARIAAILNNAGGCNGRDYRANRRRIGREISQSRWIPVEPETFLQPRHLSGVPMAADGGAVARILVVEDDEDNRRFLKELLQTDSHEVHTARDGSDALDWLHAQRILPHCILLDLDMPVMTGQELVRHLQAEPRLADIRIIVLSGDPHRHPQDCPRTIACLEKPAPPDLLIDTVTHCAAQTLDRK
jgi:CheY-like chemotaxis protein